MQNIFINTKKKKCSKTLHIIRKILQLPLKAPLLFLLTREDISLKILAVRKLQNNFK